MAKIAVEFDAGSANLEVGYAAVRPVSRLLAQGEGWSVEDLVCTSGPRDRVFEEQHSQVSIAVVLEGTFQYRAVSGHRGAGELMTPGALLLGNPGQYFECGHEHGVGDRCLSFHYSPEYFEALAADAGIPRGERHFSRFRLAAVRSTSAVVARAVSMRRYSDSTDRLDWEEFSIQMAASCLRLANGSTPGTRAAMPSTIARVTRAVRMIEGALASDLTLRELATESGLSPYHFLRVFEEVTGSTPHQYVRRARLREAASRLWSGQGSVLEIALDCGFRDASNFHRAFRTEFGLSPQRLRKYLT